MRSSIKGDEKSVVKFIKVSLSKCSHKAEKMREIATIGILFALIVCTYGQCVPSITRVTGWNFEFSELIKCKYFN